MHIVSTHVANIFSIVISAEVTDPDEQLKSTREEEALNEFVENDRILAASFPDVFLLGSVHHKNRGTLLQSQAKHVLCQYDNAAATCSELMAFLFDQRLRHSNLGGVSQTFQGSADLLEKLSKQYNTPQYLAKFEVALNNPKGQAAKSILKDFLPHLRSGGSRTRFGVFDGSALLSHVYAKSMRYGASTVFGTIAPHDSNDVTAMRFALGAFSNTTFPCVAGNDFYKTLHTHGGTLIVDANIVIPCSYSARMRMVTNNPVAAARFYSVVLEAILEHGFGHQLSSVGGRSPKLVMTGDDKCRLAGLIRSIIGAHEITSKGSIHSHFSAQGGIPPSALRKMAHIPTLRKVILEVLEQMFVTELPRELHVTRTVEAKIRDQGNGSKIGGRRLCAIFACPSITDTDAFKNHWELNGAAFQVHEHNFTCFKGILGYTGCRLCYPQYIFDESMIWQLTDDCTAEGIPKAKQDIDPIPPWDSNTYPVEPPDGRPLVTELKRRECQALPTFADLEKTASTKSTNVYNVMRDEIVKAMGEKGTDRDVHYVQTCSETHIIQVYSAVESMLPKANGNVVSFMPWLTAVTGCNTAMYHLGSETQSNASMMYIAPYTGKNKAPLERCLRTLYGVIANQDKLRSVLDKEEANKPSRRLQRVFGKTLNQLSLLDERSDSQNALALLGSGSTYDTDSYKYMNNSSLVAFSRHYANSETITTRPGGEDFEDMQNCVEDILDCGDDGEASDEEGTHASDDSDDSIGSDEDSQDVNDNEQGNYDEGTPTDGAQVEDEPDADSSLGSGKDADDGMQSVSIVDLGQAMTAGDTETNQDNVIGPPESRGVEDSPVETLFQIIGATTQSKDLYDSTCAIPTSLLNPDAPTRTNPKYDRYSATSTCLGRLRSYDIPVDSDMSWKDVQKNKREDKTKKTTKQVYEFEHMHYRLRGKQLENMSPYEYAALIKIAHRPDDEGTTTKGQNKFFHFDKASHLYPFWVQILGSAMPTLILSSRRPKWPGILSVDALKDEQDKHQKQLNDFGAFYVALFKPGIGCFAGIDNDSTQYNWLGFCTMAKGFREAKTLIGYARLDTLSKTMFAMVVASSTKEKIKTWRGRHRRMWTDTEKANNNFYNKYMKKQKSRFQTLLLDNIDHVDQAGRRKLMEMFNIRIKEQQLREEVRKSAPVDSNFFKPQTAETSFYKPGCYNYLIQDAGSIVPDLTEVYNKICAAKHDRHPITNIEDPSTGNNPSMTETEYLAKLQHILDKFIGDRVNCDKPLTNKQAAVLRTIGKSLMECSVNWKYRQSRRIKNAVYMVLGLPGVGKTTVTISISLLAKLLGAGIMVSSAWTGVAAALVDGVMLLRTFKIGGKGPQATLPLCETKLYTLQEILKANELAVFHVDECSQLDIKWIWRLHLRLCQVTGADTNYLFGGVIIIFSGDFAQNAVIGGDKIYDAMMRFASGEPSQMKSPIEWSACGLLADFKTIVLDKIVRSEKDAKHSAVVAELARGGSPTMEYIMSIKPYTVDDVTKDSSWINATWVVTTNQERLQVGYERAICWAKAHGVPLIRWRRIPTNEEDMVLVNDDDPCLWELFVPGVIGYLKTIMSADMKLTNGSFIIYDSLTFGDKATSQDVKTRLDQTKAGEFVTLLEPPLFVHVRPIDKESARRLGILQHACGWGDWNCREGQPSGVFDTSTGNSNVVIPVPRGKDCDHKKYGIMGRTSGSMVELWLAPSFPVEMALCMTSDKMQGVTLLKIVFTLAPRVNFICQFTHSRFLIAVSRVRSGEDVRAIFPRDSATGTIDYEQCRYLTRLKPAKNLTAMLAGFNADPNNMTMVVWDRALAHQKLVELHERRQRPGKKKGYFSCL
jgi:flagellar biosynthesis GTPase FlhF